MISGQRVGRGEGKKRSEVNQSCYFLGPNYTNERSADKDFDLLIISWGRLDCPRRRRAASKLTLAMGR